MCLHWLNFLDARDKACLCSTGDRYGGGDDEMEIQPDTIFIQGLGEGVTEPALAEHFGSIGVLKVGYSILSPSSGIGDLGFS